MRVEADSLKDAGDYWPKDRQEPKSCGKGNEGESLTREKVDSKDRSPSDHRVKNTFSEARSHDTMLAKSNKPEVSGTVGIETSWGGKDGTKLTFSGEGNIKDKHGNTLTARIERDSTGEKTASIDIKAGNSSDDNKHKK